MMWTGEISIGTPPKTLNADMWVLQTLTRCAGIPVNRDLWDPHSPESAKKQSQPFHLSCSVGYTVEGDQYNDNVTLAGFTSVPQTFGSATLFTDSQSHENAFADSDGLCNWANEPDILIETLSFWGRDVCRRNKQFAVQW